MDDSVVGDGRPARGTSNRGNHIMSKYNLNIKYLSTLKEVEEAIEIVNERSFATRFVFDRPLKDKFIGETCYIHETPARYNITCKLIKNRKNITFTFNRNGEPIKSDMTVASAVRQLSKAFKIQDLKNLRFDELGEIVYTEDESLSPVFKFENYFDDDMKIVGYKRTIGSATPYHFADFERIGGRTVKAFEYDMQSAYLQVLAAVRLPELKTIKFNSIVGENQIGFRTYFKFGKYKVLKFTYRKGEQCEFVFDLTSNAPYKDWALKKMKEIQECEDPNLKASLKDIPRFAVGQLQNRNPFWRCVIVETCNKIILGLEDENTIYSNTDSIVSLTERKDLEENKDWKFICKRKNEDFTLSQSSMLYQWNDETPVVGGFAKYFIEYYNLKNDKKRKLNQDSLPRELESYYKIEVKNNKLVLKINEEIKKWVNTIQLRK